MIQTGIICTNDEPGHWMINNNNDTVYTDYWLAIWTDTHSGHALNVSWDWIITESLAIWATTSWGYTLNVNWSWRIETRFNIWDNLWILNSETREVYVPIEGCPQPTYITWPTIKYDWTLAFKNDGFSCNNGYIEFGGNWRVWIGWPTEPGTKLSVYGHTKIYSTVSPDDRYIDIYNDWSKSNVISKRSDIRIWLTWDQEILGITVPSAYIYLKQTNIWINREPIPSTRNNITQQWYYSPTLQVSGSIQISSEYPISNSNQTSNKMICNQQIEWTIAYYSGNFYGCAKTSTSEYFWRLLNTSAVNGDDLPALPAPPIGSAS